MLVLVLYNMNAGMFELECVIFFVLFSTGSKCREGNVSKAWKLVMYLGVENRTCAFPYEMYCKIPVNTNRTSYTGNRNIQKLVVG
jgi:hypothetical protein